MLIGSKHTEEAKKRISNSLEGNNNALGYKHSKETRRKVSEAQLGEKKHNFGKHLSDKTKVKLSKAKKGTIAPKEARENMRKAQLKRYEDPEERRKTGEKSKGNTNVRGKHWKISEEKLRNGYYNPERIAKLKNSLCRHHIYMNKDDNKILMIPRGKHRQLHSRAYDYLVKIGKVDDYIKWFDKKYGLS